MTKGNQAFKTLIKDATVDIYVGRKEHVGGDGFRGISILVHYGSRYENGRRASTIAIKGQANVGEKPPMRHDSIQFVDDCGKFYGLTSEITIGYVGWGDRGQDAEQLRDALDKVTERYNLRYRFPECEASVLLAALDEMGATVGEVKIDGVEAWEWRRMRNEAERAAQKDRADA